jgi:hypothetical protein
MGSLSFFCVAFNLDTITNIACLSIITNQALTPYLVTPYLGVGGAKKRKGQPLRLPLKKVMWDECCSLPRLIKFYHNKKK